jgi:hypothetical protein
VFVGAGGGGDGELGVGGGVPADAREGEVADDESGVVVGGRPRVDRVLVAVALPESVPEGAYQPLSWAVTLIG